MNILYYYTAICSFANLYIWCRQEGKELAKEKKRLALNYLKNLSDLCVSTQSAGFTSRFSEGWLGICGLISALVGAYELWPRS